MPVSMGFQKVPVQWWRDLGVTSPLAASTILTKASFLRSVEPEGAVTQLIAQATAD